MIREAEPRWLIFRHPILKALVATDRDPGRPEEELGWPQGLPGRPNCRCTLADPEEIRRQLKEADPDWERRAREKLEKGVERLLGPRGWQRLAEGRAVVLKRLRRRRRWRRHDGN